MAVDQGMETVAVTPGDLHEAHPPHAQLVDAAIGRLTRRPVRAVTVVVEAAAMILTAMICLATIQTRRSATPGDWLALMVRGELSITNLRNLSSQGSRIRQGSEFGRTLCTLRSIRRQVDPMTKRCGGYVVSKTDGVLLSSSHRHHPLYLWVRLGKLRWLVRLL